MRFGQAAGTGLRDQPDTTSWQLRDTRPGPQL
jgi:hypothetical protein